MPVWSLLPPFFAPSCTHPLLLQAPPPPPPPHRPSHSPHHCVHLAPPVKKNIYSIKQLVSRHDCIYIYIYIYIYLFIIFSPCPGTQTCKPCAGWDKPRRCAELEALTAAHWRNNNQRRAGRILGTPQVSSGALWEKKQWDTVSFLKSDGALQTTQKRFQLANSALN